MLFLVFLSIILIQSSEPNFEQLAVNHFFKEILLEKYPDSETIEFRPRTDTSLYIGVVMNCTSWEIETRERISDQVPDPSVTLRIPESAVKVKKYKKGSNRLKALVSPRRQVGNKYYIYIKAYRKLRFVDHFVFEFSQEGRIIDICRVSEVI